MQRPKACQFVHHFYIWLQSLMWRSVRILARSTTKSTIIYTLSFLSFLSLWAFNALFLVFPAISPTAASNRN